MKQVQLDAAGIRIDPDPREVARQQRRQLVEALRTKASPTLADIRNLLVAVLEALEELRTE
jgi:hypothetical protein